jgi:hypothetical protein
MCSSSLSLLREGDRATHGGGAAHSAGSVAHPSTILRMVPLPQTSWGRIFVALLLATPLPAFAQQMDPNMPGMDHGKMDQTQHQPADTQRPASRIKSMTETFWVDCPPTNGNEIVMDCSNAPFVSVGSGTSRLPAYEGAMHGLHIMPGDDWMLMLHGYAWGVYTDQSGPRGDKGVFVQSMAMLTAEKDTSWGRVQVKSMLSLEPLMGARGYPNLFATGETAGGEPLVDRQHPHDLFMELAARVDVNVKGGSLFLYGGPVGEPALGPSAFMHRSSAKLNPEAPITHHWFDSTHITYGVATVGLATRSLQLETSLFTGREPDERRWNIETPRFDSWSVRATWNPSPRWAVQASTARLKRPEFLIHPDEDEQRTTASVHFVNGQGLSAMVAFAAKDRKPGPAITAWLAEANWDLSDHHTIFGRIENVANDELFPDENDPLHERSFRVSKFRLGYAYRMPLGESPVTLALGSTVSVSAKPSALDAAYGKNPMGMTVFAKLSLGH